MPVAALPPSGASPRALQVLVVEDSEIDARVLIVTLRQGGYQPVWRRVASREGMREALATAVWELILCDHRMPGFSAPEALELLQSTGLDVPFLIVSGEIGEDVAVAAMKAGANDYLIKGSLARLVPAVEREIREAGIRAARRAAENALRESELRYRLVWENSADAVLLLDADGLIRFSNPAVRTVFGWNPDELNGHRLDVLQPRELASGTWWNSRSSHPGDTVGLRRDGTHVDVDIAFSELRLHERQLVAAFIRDVRARKLAEAELSRNREEFAAARTIQQRLFPKDAPALAGFDLAGVSRPAEAAGGDYFDYVPLEGGMLGILVADVSGHGLGAALLMAEARTCLRLLSRRASDPAAILTEANGLLAEDLVGGQYITLLLARLDPASGMITFASAGHPAGLLLSYDGSLKAELKRTGPPLGQRREFAYTSGGSFRLAPGDTLALVTDGILESARGTQGFGRERLMEVIRSSRDQAARDTVQSLVDAAEDFFLPAPQADDLTVVVLKCGRTGTPATSLVRP